LGCGAFVRTVIDGKFADGAVYPRPFIFVDQIYLVLLCVAGAVALGEF
jgi:hypothetical protein